MKNMYETFIEGLGLKMNEEFDIISQIPTIHTTYRYKFESKTGLVDNDGNVSPAVLNGILTGEFKVVKIPENPKTVWDLQIDDDYFILITQGNVFHITWRGDEGDFNYLAQGNVFLTREEAEFESKRREVETILKKYSRPFVESKEKLGNALLV